MSPWEANVGAIAGQLELTGLQQLEQKLLALADHDFSALMDQWEKVLQEDNKRAALEGLDGDGRDLEPVSYRPVDVAVVDFRILDHNNLTSSRYRSLDGPPLAPRGLESRIVTEFRTASARLSDNSWAVVGAWEGVRDVKGRPFLAAHFEGRGHLPKRDLRGVRPRAVDEARQAAEAYLREVLAAFPSLAP